MSSRPSALLRACVAISCLVAAALPFRAAANAVFEWNEAAFRVTVAGGTR